MALDPPHYRKLSEKACPYNKWMLKDYRINNQCSKCHLKPRMKTFSQ